NVLQSNSISGELDWQQQSITLPAGDLTLRWRYTKDQDTSEGLDAAWLDEVSFISLSWLEIAASSTNGPCELILHGTPGKIYEVQCSSDLLTWFSLGSVMLTTNSMAFTDETAGSGMKFYRLRELSNG